MKLETLATLAAWARDPVYGINAQLPNVPRLAGVDAPPSVSIFDELTDEAAALGAIPQDPDDLPAVLISCYLSPLEQSVPSVSPWPPDGQVEIAFRYVAKNSDTPEGKRDEGITLRAIWRCLPRIMTTTEGLTLRQATADTALVQLLGIVSMRELTLSTPQQSNSITGAVLVSLRARDLHASAQS